MWRWRHSLSAASSRCDSMILSFVEARRPPFFGRLKRNLPSGAAAAAAASPPYSCASMLRASSTPSAVGSQRSTSPFEPLPSEPPRSV